MRLPHDKIWKGAVAGTFALFMAGGCETTEGIGEDIAWTGEAIQDSVTDDSSDMSRVETVDRTEWRSSDSEYQYIDREVAMQAQRFDAGLFDAEGDRIDAQQRQQLAQSDLDNREQVFGFAEDQQARQQNQRQQQQGQQQLSGTIQDVARVPHITLRTDDGREVIAMLQEDQAQKVQLRQGQKVQLTGTMQDHEGKPLFMISSIKPQEQAQQDNQAFGFAADQQQQDKQDKQAKAQKKRALVGTVQSIEKGDTPQSTKLTIKTEKGKTFKADLSGVQDAASINAIQQGEKVTLIGKLEGKGEQQVFKAEKLHKGEHADAQALGFVGEDERLMGKWQVQREGQQHGSLMSEGRTIKIDLSNLNREKLQQLNLQGDEQVTVTGSFQDQNGQQVFVASDLKKGSEQDQSSQQNQQQNSDQQAPAPPQDRSNQQPE